MAPPTPSAPPGPGPRPDSRLPLVFTLSPRCGFPLPGRRRPPLGRASTKETVAGNRHRAGTEGVAGAPPSGGGHAPISRSPWSARAAPAHRRSTSRSCPAGSGARTARWPSRERVSSSPPARPAGAVTTRHSTPASAAPAGREVTRTAVGPPPPGGRDSLAGSSLAHVRAALHGALRGPVAGGQRLESRPSRRPAGEPGERRPAPVRERDGVEVQGVRPAGGRVGGDRGEPVGALPPGLPPGERRQNADGRAPIGPPDRAAERGWRGR